MAESPVNLACRRCHRNEKPLVGNTMCASCNVGFYTRRKRLGGKLTLDEYFQKFPFREKPFSAAPPKIVFRPRPVASVIPLGVPHELIPGFLYAGPKIQRLVDVVRKLAAKDVPVLIVGETGSGKELIARALHELSPRKHKPLKVVDCTTLTHELAASELFGHVQGAFTNATKSKTGLFGLANQGTIFLDELSTLPLDIQPKFLRILEEQEYRPVGGGEYLPVDARIISATNQPLEELVQQGRFRADLFYRLNVFCLRVPPLRERKDELPMLIRYLLRKLSEDLVEVKPEALNILMNYDWPGNIRELKNVLTRALLLRDNDHQPVTTKELPEEIFYTSIASIAKE